MESYYRAMRGAVEAHGGTVVKLLGDGVMAAFGVPRVAEDDAIRAVRAGVGMQHAFRTILFTDLEAHTAMMQRLGNARGRDVLRKHERLTREALRAHGWTEIHSSALPRSHFIMVA